MKNNWIAFSVLPFVFLVAHAAQAEPAIVDESPLDLHPVIVSPSPLPIVPSPTPSVSPSFSATMGMSSLPPAPVLTLMPIHSGVPVSAPVVAVTPSPVPTIAPVVVATPIVPVTLVVSHQQPDLLPPVTISVLGGGQSVSLSEVNSLVGTKLFQSAIYYGAELRYPVSDDWSLLLRGERMSNSSAVGAAAFSLSSIPVMTGIDFHSHHQRKFKFHISALVGMALKTDLNETASSLPAPNVTDFTASSLTEMIRLSLEYPVSHKIGLFVEGGYRLLKTSSISPSPTGSGGTIFQLNGQYQAVPLNLSGPFVGGGFVFVL